MKVPHNYSNIYAFTKEMIKEVIEESIKISEHGRTLGETLPYSEIEGMNIWLNFKGIYYNSMIDEEKNYIEDIFNEVLLEQPSIKI